ncbi:MAG: restriction endonuclease [Bacteroidia bacterium]
MESEHSYEEYTNLRSAFLSANIPVRQPESLPYSNISWEEFERLCADVANTQYDKIRIYLSHGHAQDGIDIYCIKKQEAIATFIQCKKYTNLSATKLAEAVDKFKNGRFKASCKEFIICIAHDLRTDSALETKYIALRAELLEEGIELTLWDTQQLDKQLKQLPQIVYDIFDRGQEPVWVGAFCGQRVASELIASWKPKPTPKKYSLFVNYIPRQLTSTSKDLGTLQDYLFTDKQKNILIKSAAGNGKTTELAYWAGILSSQPQQYLLFALLRRLSGYAYADLDNLLQSEIENWNNIPETQLIIFLDGLDEVPDHAAVTVRGAIFQLRSRKPNAKLVITTRSNLFRFDDNDPDWADFKQLRLDEFSQREITLYTESKLANNSNAFLKIIERRNIQELAKSPFSLVYLVELFIQDGENGIPNSRGELMESLLHHAVKKDTTHFSAKGVNYEDQWPQTQLALETAAFAIALSGKRRLDNGEIMEITSTEDLALLRQFSLLDSSNGWEFRHNNFQEYLVAKMLSRLAVSSIKELITFTDNRNWIKPKWRNIVTLLFDCLEQNSEKYNELLSWILTNQPEALLQIETDKISEGNRLRIFIAIYNHCKQKDMYPSRADYTVRDLVRFVGVQRKFIEFISNELATCPDGSIKILLYDLLEEYQGDYLDFSTIIRNKTESEIKRIETTATICERALQVFLRLSSEKRKDVQWLQDNCSFIINHEVRREVYQFILDNDISDDTIDFLVRGIDIHNGYRKQESIRVSFSERALQSCIDQLKIPTSIIKVLEIIISIKGPDRYSPFEIDDYITNVFLQNAALATNRDDKIFDLILELTLLLDEQRLIRKPNSLGTISYFITSATNERAFDELLKRKEEDTLPNHVYCIHSYFATQSILEKLVHGFIAGTVSEDIIWSTLRGLGYYNKAEEWKWFYEKINSVAANKFTYQEQPNWEKIQQKKLENDLAALLDRETYKAHVANIFATVEKERITASDLSNYRRGNLDIEDSTLSNITLWELQTDLKKQADISYSEAVNWLSNDETWENYQRAELLRKINAGHKLNEACNKYLHDWFRKVEDEVHFENAIWTEAGDTYYKIREAQFAAIYEYLPVNVNDQLALQMIAFDHLGYFENHEKGKKEPSLSDIIFQRTSDKEAFKIRVRLNLENGINNSMILLNHIRLAKELGLIDIQNVLLKYIRDPAGDHHAKRKALDLYYELNGDPQNILSILFKENTLDYWQKELLGYLEQSYSVECCEWLLLRLPTITHESEFALSTYEALINNGHIEGLNGLIILITNQKAFPSRTGRFTLKKFNIEAILEPLASLLEAAVINSFKTERFDSPSMIVEWIFEAIKSQADLRMVSERLKNAITKFRSSILNVTNYEHQIDRLTSEYYKQKEEIFSMREIRYIYQQVIAS